MTVENGESNPCCFQLAEKVKTLEEKRLALRDGIKLLKQGTKALQQQVDSLQSENNNLKKELEEQRTRTDSERDEKIKESGAKICLEGEVSALKSEIVLLQQKVKAQTLGADKEAHVKDLEMEIERLKTCMEQETLKIDLERKEVNRLKGVLDMRMKCEEKKLMVERRSAEEARKIANSERTNAKEERRCVDNELKKAEECRKQLLLAKAKAEEERRRADNERKKADETRTQLQLAKEEMEQVRRKLVLENSKVEEAQKRLESEKDEVMVARKQSDSMIENLKKETQAAREEASEQKSRADNLSQLLEEHKLKLEELQSDGDKLSSLRPPNAGPNCLKPEPAKYDPSLVILGSGDIRNIETIKKKGCEKLKCKVDKLQGINKLESSIKSSRESVLSGGDAITIIDSEKVKLLKKQLKLEKERVAHAYDVAKLEKVRCSLLNKELYFLKQDFLRLSRRISSLDGFMSSCSEGIDDIVQKNSACTALLDARGGYIESISGINSELDPLHGGHPRKTLQSSAINSTAVSLSDKKLIGSQERNAFSGASSAHIGSKSHFNYNESHGIVVENGDRNTPGPEVIGQMNLHGKKRKRVSSAIESLGYLHSESKKLNLQMEENLTSLNCMLTAKKNSIGIENNNRDLDEHEGLGKNKRDSSDHQDLIQDSCEKSSEQYAAEHCKSEWRNLEEITISEMIAKDYMKVLELDNPIDEERYQMAIQMPLSPTIPDIMFSQLEEASGNHLMGEEPYMVSNSAETVGVHFDGANHNSISNVINLSGVMEVCANSASFANNAGTLSGPPVGAGTSNHLENPFILPKESSHGTVPVCLIAFPEIGKKCVISRIFHATQNCFSDSSLASRNNWALQDIVFTLMRENGLLPKEKACVFFSLLLWHVSGASPISSENFSAETFRMCCNSFTLHVSEVMNNVGVRSTFAKLFDLEELFSLIEDFLICRILLVSEVIPNGLHEDDSVIELSLGSRNVAVLRKMASACQLVASGVILASLCLAHEKIIFLCEISCSILKINEFDRSLLLIIVHVFAQLCGDVYLNSNVHNPCHPTVTVIKSLIVFIESKELPCLRCANCPFSKGAILMETIVDFLLKKLQRLSSSADVDRILIERFVSVNVDAVNTWKRGEYISGNHNIALEVGHDLLQSEVGFDLAACDCSDVFSLVEMVAFAMPWNWTCQKVLPRLFKIMSSCVSMNFSAVIIILLGQIGRFGVDVTGIHDPGVANIRSELLSSQRSFTNHNTDFIVQLVSVHALLGLIPLDFSEIIAENLQLSKSSIRSSCSADLVRKWFSSLSRKQQKLSRLFVEDSMSICSIND